jgi:hypothetical protein
MSLPYTSIVSGGLALEGNGTIKPSLILDCADSCGTAGQILSSTGTALEWIAAGGSAATPTVAGLVLGCTSLADSAALGCNALVSLTTGTENVALGPESLRSITTGSTNVAVGTYALYCSETAELNVALGYAAGYGAICSYNTLIGAGAGETQTTGEYNVALGYNVQLPDPAGSYQLAIGHESNVNWLTGDSTLAIKPGAGIIDCAGSCGTTGQVLSSVGNAICWITPAGASSATPTTVGTVYGYVSDGTNTNLNTSVGYASLANITVPGAAGNAALGSCALGSLSTGVTNVAVGVSALFSGTTLCSNVAIGTQAGFALENSNGNTLVGRTSGLDLSSGNDNVFLGNGSGAAQTAGDCNVAIGSGAALANLTGSCQLAIGFSTIDNWLTGDCTKAIKPGAGIIDCAGSCGTSGQILQSTGSNAIQWASPGASYSGYNAYKSAVTTGTAFNVTGWPREVGRNWIGQLNIFTTYGTDPTSEYFPAANALIMVNGFNGVGSTTVQAFNTSSGVFTVEANSYPAYTDTTIVFTPSVTTDRMNFYIRYLDSSGNGGPANGDIFTPFLTVF